LQENTPMKIIECPRDAMQGLHEFIPTEKKVAYINALLKVGFETIDFGSFVSPKAIPQMSDTADVLAQLQLGGSKSKLLAIVANVRGAEAASAFDEIAYLGYPLSLSETFQQRNTNRSIDEAMNNLAEIQEICEETDKTMVTYLSMGFGNPYGDPYEMNYIGEFVSQLDELEVQIVSLSDTIGVATPELITQVFSSVIPKFPHIEFGAHLHSTPDQAASKVVAAYEAGCRRMDGAIRGFGGCPMAKDDLTGNMPTEVILKTLEELGCHSELNQEGFDESLALSHSVFG
ncbi:MAG: hydroxymethylglutaryl-CoA lyase, partial [Cyclobacteriaceae bacterium]